MEYADLVPGQGVQVDAEVLDVDSVVRRIANAVDADQDVGVVVVDGGGDGLDIVDGAENVACVGASHQTGFVREEGSEVRGQEFGVGSGAGGVLVGLPPLEDEFLALGEVHPWCDVRLMVEEGHNQLIAFLELQGV
jgi:hypothetical protein